MTKIEIELTEQQEKFLKEFASKHYDGAKDNLYTADAFHVVETKRLEYIPYSEDIVDWYGELPLKFTTDDDYEVWYNDEIELIKEHYEECGKKCPIEIVPYSDYIDIESIYGNDVFITNYEQYFEAYGIEIKGIAWEKYTYEPVAFFFILDEAKRYIQYQRHNLRQPRTYTYSAGYSNYGDFVPFRNLLLSIGKKLNKDTKGESYDERIINYRLCTTIF